MLGLFVTFRKHLAAAAKGVGDRQPATEQSAAGACECAHLGTGRKIRMYISRRFFN